MDDLRPHHPQAAAAQLPPASEPIAAVAAALSSEEIPVAEAIMTQLRASMAELANADEELIEQTFLAVLANVRTCLAMLRRSMPPSAVDAPLEALEYARELAHRGVDVGTIARMYRIGTGVMLRHWMPEVLRRERDDVRRTELLDESAALIFTYTDMAVERLRGAHAAERERLRQGNAGARADVVAEVLAGGTLDVDAASRRLAYDLRQRHVALVAWVDDPSASDRAGERLEAAAVEISGVLAAGSVLLVPAGRRTLWGWAGAGEDADTALQRLSDRGAEELPTGVRVAIGEPEAGADGFGSSHREALEARRVVELLPERHPALVRYREVEVVSLLSADIARASRFARRTLGPLLCTDDATERLRATLLAYLQADASPQRAAVALGVHRNTVAYRVRRAEELLGAPVMTRRLEVKLALRLAQALGAGALRGEAAEAG